ncbi:MAG: Right handed beta helix region, partial [Alphaproteobacteria bacterium]|nr:Right handed beta helix region [Alphaproteobacteria bacterium]
NRIHINGRTSVAKFAERGIQVANSSEVLLDGVTVLNTDAVAGNCIAVGNSTNIKIVSAFVDAKGAASFAIHFTPTCLNSGIANSIVLNSQLEAIAGTNCRDLFVTGNTLKWPDNPGHDSANSYGDCPNLIVANNQIVGPGGMGMIVDAGCYNFVIDNNIIQNAGTFSPNSPVGTLHANGIEIWPSSNAVIDAYVGGSVTNNIIANAEGANKCQYGVRELSVAEIGYGTGNPNRTTIVNNTCINMAGGAIHTVGTDSYIGLNTQRVGNLTTMIGSNNDIVLPTPGKGLSFTGSGSNIKWGAREIINVAPGASLGTGIGSGLIMFHDISVGGGALVFFDAGSAGYKIIAELGTSIFVTSDPGPGSDKWWIQHAGVITNRFSVSHALDYALVSSRGGTLV